jgi:hypothetical protein
MFASNSLLIHCLRGASQCPAPREKPLDRGATKEEARHRKMNFDEEFLALLRKHGVAFDPEFVFG